MIELAATIINEEDQDTHFKGQGGFPTRLAEYVMYAGATAAVAALAYRFFPKEGPSISVRHGDSDYSTRNSWGLFWEGVKDSWHQHNATGTRISHHWQEVTLQPTQLPNVKNILNIQTLHKVYMADLLPHALKGLVGPAAAVVGVGVLVWLYLVNHPELLEHLAKGWDQLLVHLGEARDKIMEWFGQAGEAISGFAGKVRDDFISWLGRLRSLFVQKAHRIT